MSMNGRRRVVVTGLGRGDAARQRRRDDLGEPDRRRVRRGPITLFDPAEFPVALRLRAEGLRPDRVDRPQGRRAAWTASRRWSSRRRARPRRTPGSTSRPRPTASAPRSRPASAASSPSRTATTTLIERGPDRVNPFSIPSIIPNMGAAWVSMELGTRGPLSLAVHRLRGLEHGDRRGAGRDPARPRRRDVLRRHRGAAITQVGIAGFGAMRALSRRNDDPSGREPAVRRRPRRVRHGRGGRDRSCSRSSSTREARGAKIYAELLGYGVSSDADAHHRARPDRREPGARDADGARATPASTPEEIDYINAHGTSTPLGDASETRVIKLALGEETRATDAGLLDEGRDRPLPRRRRRGRGDLLDAGAAATACCRRRSTTTTPDPECDLDYIPNEAREADIRVAVSNSFGFGGHNASILVNT